jgi:hypothetical protein
MGKNEISEDKRNRREDTFSLKNKLIQMKHLSI